MRMRTDCWDWTRHDARWVTRSAVGESHLGERCSYLQLCTWHELVGFWIVAVVNSRHHCVSDCLFLMGIRHWLGRKAASSMC